MIDINDFPILRGSLSEKNVQRLSESINLISDAIGAQKIRNVDLKNATHIISSAVDSAWERSVGEPFFFRGKINEQPDDVRALYDGITMYGIHSVAATGKKLDKTAASSEAVDAMKRLVTELLPLANAVASLKGKVVKGRVSSAGTTKAVNPGKVVKTCPCCFRAIAVQNEKMAHHGYSRPAIGWQTSSCPGIKFPPLEVSNKGLLWIIDQYKTSLAKMENDYANSDKWSSVSYQEPSGLLASQRIEPGSPLWEKQFKHAQDKLKGQIFHTKLALKELEERLSCWEPEEDELVLSDDAIKQEGDGQSFDFLNYP